MSDSQRKELPIVSEQSGGAEQMPSHEQLPETPLMPAQAAEAPMAPPAVVLPNSGTVTPVYVGDTIILAKVEKILAENMDNVFLTMDATTQQHFKIKGEATAKKIATLFTKARVKVKDVIGLIIEWLKTIPLVNRYYMEQEAKLKADAILRIYKNK